MLAAFEESALVDQPEAVSAFWKELGRGCDTAPVELGKLDDNDKVRAYMRGVCNRRGPRALGWLSEHFNENRCQANSRLTAAVRVGYSYR